MRSLRSSRKNSMPDVGRRRFFRVLKFSLSSLLLFFVDRQRESEQNSSRGRVLGSPFRFRSARSVHFCSALLPKAVSVLAVARQNDPKHDCRRSDGRRRFAIAVKGAPLPARVPRHQVRPGRARPALLRLRALRVSERATKEEKTEQRRQTETSIGKGRSIAGSSLPLNLDPFSLLPQRTQDVLLEKAPAPVVLAQAQLADAEGQVRQAQGRARGDVGSRVRTSLCF